MHIRGPSLETKKAKNYDARDSAMLISGHDRRKSAGIDGKSENTDDEKEKHGNSKETVAVEISTESEKPRYNWRKKTDEKLKEVCKKEKNGKEASNVSFIHGEMCSVEGRRMSSKHREEVRKQCSLTKYIQCSTIIIKKKILVFEKFKKKNR